MSEKCLCPRCGQPLPSQARGGIYLPARKVQIFDFIDKHPGITAEGVAYHCGITAGCVRQHVWQINEMLESTYVRIVCKRICNDPGCYRVSRSKNAKAQG